MSLKRDFQILCLDGTKADWMAWLWMGWLDGLDGVRLSVCELIVPT